jgi:hypothetical protein
LNVLDQRIFSRCSAELEVFAVRVAASLGLQSLANASQLFLVDPEELPNGESFIYYIVANLADGNVSGRSVDKTIAARNDPPLAGTGNDVIANTYSGNPNSTLTVAAPGVLGNDKAGA